MNIDPKKLLTELLGRRIAEPSAPTSTLAPSAPPELALPALEMASTLTRTKDFLANRSNLRSGLGGANLTHLPAWTGASVPPPTGTSTRTSWIGYLDSIMRSPVTVARMPADAASLLDFVRDHENRYRYLPGNEGLSLDTTLPAVGTAIPGENVIGGHTAANSAILNQLSQVWGKSSGPMPVSAQRVGQIAMRRPPTHRLPATQQLPQQEKNVEQAVASMIVPTAEKIVQGTPGVAGSASGLLAKVFTPFHKTVSVGWSAVENLMGKVAPAPKGGTDEAPSFAEGKREEAVISTGETPRLLTVPLANKISGVPESSYALTEATSSEKMTSDKLTTKLLPLTGHAKRISRSTAAETDAGLTEEKRTAEPPPLSAKSAATFSKKIAEDVEKIVPNVAQKFPSVGKKSVEKLGEATQRQIIASSGAASKSHWPETETRKIIAKASDAKNVVSIEGRTSEPLLGNDQISSELVLPKAGKEPSSGAEKLEMPLVVETTKSPVKGTIASLATSENQGKAGSAVSWARQIVEKHIPATFGVTKKLLPELAIPASLEALNENAAGALGSTASELTGAVEHPLKAARREMKWPSFGGLMEKHPLEAAERTIGLPASVSSALEHPLETLQRSVSKPEMPLAPPAGALEITAGGLSGAAGEVERTLPFSIPKGEVSEVESEIGKYPGETEEGAKPPDMDGLMDEIYQRLLHRLKMERERRGF